MEVKEGLKTCTKCQQEKIFSEFYKDSHTKSGLHPWCKSCNAKRQKDHRQGNPEYYKKLAWERNILKKGATVDQWNAKFLEQNGCCAICGIHQSNCNKRFATDHDHNTGKFRGLLCDVCNRGIGLLKDDMILLLKAADYLGSYKDGTGTEEVQQPEGAGASTR